ncbi:MAG: hypothetical protein GY707_14725 [Desulfobacteraceae bacterium]|nr:hypothetical protein [Desulfobacteraceae bacterium]
MPPRKYPKKKGRKKVLPPLDEDPLPPGDPSASDPGARDPGAAARVSGGAGARDPGAAARVSGGAGAGDLGDVDGRVAGAGADADARVATPVHTHPPMDDDPDAGARDLGDVDGHVPGAGVHARGATPIHIPPMDGEEQTDARYIFIIVFI